MRFTGQGYEISVDLPDGPYAAADVARLHEAFFDAYAASYGDRAFDRADAVELVHFRIAASGPVAPMALQSLPARDGSAADARKGHRRVYFPETNGFTDCPVYDRYQLRAGDRFDGPALVEERESTVVIIPHSQAHVDRDGNIIVDLTAIESTP